MVFSCLGKFQPVSFAHSPISQVKRVSHPEPALWAARFALRALRMTDIANRGTEKAGFGCGPRPVAGVDRGGRNRVLGVNRARLQGRPRPVGRVYRVGGKMGWIRGRRLGKGLILLERGFWENFSGAKIIVWLYFLRLAGWIILFATEVARTAWFASGASVRVATKVARTFFFVARAFVFSSRTKLFAVRASEFVARTTLFGLGADDAV